MVELKTEETLKAYEELVEAGRKFQDFHCQIDEALKNSASKSAAEKFPDNLFDIITSTMPKEEELPEIVQKNKGEIRDLYSSHRDIAANHPIFSVLLRDEISKENPSRHILATEKWANIFMHPIECPEDDTNSLHYKQEAEDFYVGKMLDLAKDKDHPEFVATLEGFKESLREVTEKYTAFGLTVMPLLPGKDPVALRI